MTKLEADITIIGAGLVGSLFANFAAAVWGCSWRRGSDLRGGDGI